MLEPSWGPERILGEGGKVTGLKVIECTRVFDDYDVAELVPYIDWTPFFRTWGIRSKFPEVLTDPEFADAADACSYLFQGLLPGAPGSTPTTEGG